MKVVQPLVRCAAVLAAVCASGCGLANGLVHTGSAVHSDVIGYCLWCNDEGFPCAVEGEEASCRRASSFTACDGIDDPDIGLGFDAGDAFDAILSPIGDAVGEGAVLRELDDADTCPDGFRAGAVDLLLQGASLPSALREEDVVVDLDALAAVVRVATTDALFVRALAVTPVAVPWPRSGSASLVTALVCTLDEDDGDDGLAIAIADSNPLCVFEDG